MQIEIFCLCKGVSINAANQPSLLGIFDKKVAAGEPVLIDEFVVAAAIRFYKADSGMHRFNFIVKESGGKILQDSQEIVSISDLAGDSTTYFLQTIMGSVGLKFGTYEFSIESGGKQLAHTPLYIVRENISQ